MSIVDKEKKGEKQMNKTTLEEITKKVAQIEVGEFEIGVLVGMSIQYDKETDPEDKKTA